MTSPKKIKEQIESDQELRTKCLTSNELCMICRKWGIESMTEKRERNTVLTALDIFDSELQVLNKKKNVRRVQSG